MSFMRIKIEGEGNSAPWYTVPLAGEVCGRRLKVIMGSIESYLGDWLLNPSGISFFICNIKGSP